MLFRENIYYAKGESRVVHISASTWLLIFSQQAQYNTESVSSGTLLIQNVLHLITHFSTCGSSQYLVEVEQLLT
jgi:hypothetical protein